MFFIGGVGDQPLMLTLPKGCKMHTDKTLSPKDRKKSMLSTWKYGGNKSNGKEASHIQKIVRPTPRNKTFKWSNWIIYSLLWNLTKEISKTIYFVVAELLWKIWGWGLFHFKMLRAARYVTTACSFKALEDRPDGNLALLKYSSWVVSALL